MRNPVLITENGIKEHLSSLYHKDNSTVIKIMDATEDSATAEMLAENLNKLRLFSKFSVDRETTEYARLVTTDCFGDRHYFIAEK